jgi:dolichol-phosphate mannosyltransferase
VAIPCYRVKAFILDVLQAIGPEVARIYVVDDACPEKSGSLVEQTCTDHRVKVLFNEQNQGVGGAVLRGYNQALADGDVDIVVKVDGDGQMDPRFINFLIRPIVEGRADYTKGNRFFRLDSLRTMPKGRLFGNSILSFMAKLSTGYWTLFDPTNGYTAVHCKVLAELPLDKISKRFFFETDMLFRLNTIRCVVEDVPMKAIYGNEPSNLKIGQIIPEFIWKHLVNFCKRLFYNYLLRNFSVFSIELLIGTLLFVLGSIFGLLMWYHFSIRGVYAPSGIVMFAALPIIIGIQFVLSFLHWDVSNVPKEPLQRRL